ncbi:hypothetical protein KP509_10G023200 [Ceratopteris richardii]|uniref:Uncharacterized protein n=1 Tax=Ceratopteris richardii TaxID=49495 RepID=A0A8T2TX24_CERRI|nr:hypothetical protein KP509_10G023200 [Ceratopteris richardii]
MEKHHLILASASVLLTFLLPFVAARPGGRLCRTSFFFPDPDNVRMVTVIGNFNGVPTGLKFFSIRNNAFFDSPSELLQVYRSSSSNPHRLQTFYVRFRPGLWRPEEMSTKAEQMSSPVIEGNVLWNFSVMFLLGLAFFLAATSVVLCILRICFKPSPEEQEIGFLYGYQELPSAEESEKEAAQKEYAAKEAAQKEFAAKESAAKAESVAIVP